MEFQQYSEKQPSLAFINKTYGIEENQKLLHGILEIKNICPAEAKREPFQTGQKRPRLQFMSKFTNKAWTVPDFQQQFKEAGHVAALSQKICPVKSVSAADERECLAKALQSNITYIVDNLQFNQSDLPEKLISSGQITEDECSILRSLKNRKDQVRLLVSRTKCRRVIDMQIFLELIETHVPGISDMTYAKFEENKRNNMKCRSCALCQCFNAIDIKDIVDVMWSRSAISDGLFNEIAMCDSPRGAQDQLWLKIIEHLNSYPKETKRQLYHDMFQCILLKGNFDFIVRPLEQLLSKTGILKCSCLLSRKFYCIPRDSSGTVSTVNTLSSHSPLSSLSSGCSSSVNSMELYPDKGLTSREGNECRGIDNLAHAIPRKGSPSIENPFEYKSEFCGDSLGTINEENGFSTQSAKEDKDIILRTFSGTIVHQLDTACNADSDRSANKDNKSDRSKRNAFLEETSTVWYC